MTIVSQFVLDTNRALQAHGDYNANDYVNADPFDAQQKFNDIWNECQSEVTIQYSLPPFHLWESGYEKGDATDGEVKQAVKKINTIESKEVVSVDTIYDFLNQKFIERIALKATALIKDCETFCAGVLAAK